MRLRGSINIFTAQLLPLRFRKHEKGRKYFLQVLENQKIRGETMSGRMTSKLQNLDPNNVSLKKAYNIDRLIALEEVRYKLDSHDQTKNLFFSLKKKKNKGEGVLVSHKNYSPN